VLLARWERVPCQGVRPGRAELVEVAVLLARRKWVPFQGVRPGRAGLVGAAVLLARWEQVWCQGVRPGRAEVVGAPMSLASRKGKACQAIRPGLARRGWEASLPPNRVRADLVAPALAEQDPGLRGGRVPQATRLAGSLPVGTCPGGRCRMGTRPEGMCRMGTRLTRCPLAAEHPECAQAASTSMGYWAARHRGERANLRAQPERGLDIESVVWRAGWRRPAPATVAARIGCHAPKSSVHHHPPAVGQSQDYYPQSRTSQNSNGRVANIATFDWTTV
jgi:hypothetical protein